MIINKEIFAQFTKEDIINFDKVIGLLIAHSKDPKEAYIALHKSGLSNVLDQFRSIVFEANHE